MRFNWRACSACPAATSTGQAEHARQLKRMLGQYDFEGALAQLGEVADALELTL